MVEMSNTLPTMLETGVPNLDLVLGGGLQKHNSYIIAGPPGAGKSVLSQQISFYRAKQGDRVLLITGLDEPHHNLLEHWRTLRFVDPSLVGPQIETVSLVPFLEKPVAEKIDVLRRTVLNARPDLVTLEGLRSYEVFLGGPEGIHEFIYGLTSWFAVEGITLLVTKETEPLAVPDSPEFSLLDGAILIWRDLSDGYSMRRLWVEKMRGQKALEGLHSFSIDENGVTVWPRPQASFALKERQWSESRLAFGIAGLDGMLQGGLPEGTATLLAGDPGVGKTALGLSFLNEGVRRGEPGLWVGFRETRSRLLGMCRQWASALSEAESRGQISFLSMAPFTTELNHLAAEIQSALAKAGARRLVLDGADMLENAPAGLDEADAFLSWLTQAMPQQGITALITQQLAPSMGSGFRSPESAAARAADNLLVARRLWRGDRLRSAIAVLKMSLAGFDAAVRELQVSPQGVSIGEPLMSENGAGQPEPRASAEPVAGPVV